MAERHCHAFYIPNFDRLKGAWRGVHNSDEAIQAIMAACDRYKPRVDYRTNEQREGVVQMLARAREASKHVVAGYDWYDSVADTEYHMTMFDDGSVYRLAIQNGGFIMSTGFSSLQEVLDHSLDVPESVRTSYAKLVFVSCPGD